MQITGGIMLSDDHNIERLEHQDTEQTSPSDNLNTTSQDHHHTHDADESNEFDIKVQSSRIQPMTHFKQDEGNVR